MLLAKTDFNFQACVALYVAYVMGPQYCDSIATDEGFPHEHENGQVMQRVSM